MFKIATLTIGLFLTQNVSLTNLNPKVEINVFVCDSKSSIAYHSKKTCRGLQKCNHEIIEVTKEKAITNYKKRACKLCY